MAGANCRNPYKLLKSLGVPYGIRTRVTAVKGRCPGPLDERDRAVGSGSRSGCRRSSQGGRPNPGRARRAAAQTPASPPRQIVLAQVAGFVFWFRSCHPISPCPRPNASPASSTGCARPWRRAAPAGFCQFRCWCWCGRGYGRHPAASSASPPAPRPARCPPSRVPRVPRRQARRRESRSGACRVAPAG